MIILETCGLWDFDYNSDNSEPEFMTIFVTIRSVVTLDSIRNSCNVYFHWKFQHNISNQVNFLFVFVQNWKSLSAIPYL